MEAGRWHHPVCLLENLFPQHSAVLALPEPCPPGLTPCLSRPSSAFCQHLPICSSAKVSAAVAIQVPYG